MRCVPALAFLAVAALAFSGCASVSDEPSTTSPARSAPGGTIGAALGAVESGNSSAILLAGEATQGWTLTGFRWTVPPGTAHQEARFPGEAVVTLHGRPFQAATNATAWALHVYKLDEGKAHLLSAYWAVPAHLTSRVALASTEENLEADFSSFGMVLVAKDGDTLGFVLAAQAAAPQPFAVALRPESVDDSEDFSMRRYQGAIALPVVGDGTGFALQGYGDGNFGTGGSEVSAGNVTVQDRIPVDTRPVATGRDVTITASAPGGWSSAVGVYVGAASHGTWDMRANLHGTALAADSVVAQDWIPQGALAAETAAVGVPGYVVEAEGTEPASVQFHLRVTDAKEPTFLLFIQVNLGANLTTLVGAPAAARAVTFPGLLDSAPPDFLKGGDGHEVLHAAGVSYTLATRERQGQPQ